MWCSSKFLFLSCNHLAEQWGKSGTIVESNQASGVRKAHCVRKSSILLARTGVRKISSVACGFSFDNNPLFCQQN